MNSLIMDQNSKLADTQFDQNISSLKEGLVNAKPKKDAMNIFNSKKVVAEYQRKPIHKFSTQRNEGNEMIIEDANSY